LLEGPQAVRNAAKTPIAIKTTLDLFFMAHLPSIIVIWNDTLGKRKGVVELYRYIVSPLWG
jgi:hypothetical protein